MTPRGNQPTSTFLRDAWEAVKLRIFGLQSNHFLTNKGTNFQKDTILFEEGKLVNDQQEICDIFNNFFVNVAKKYWRKLNSCRESTSKHYKKSRE